MSDAPNSGNQYQVGGSLPESATTYVKRQADKDFYEGLRAGEFCYVLNSRQMGKSSLRVQTMKSLKEEGVACAAIEMRELCSYQVTKDEFYGGFISRLVSEFNLKIDLSDWWNKQGLISSAERLSKFMSEELLDNVIQKIVIFVDEIDSILNLEFKDDFFAFLRSCFENRAKNTNYNRLTFALLGVAAPADLITDRINLTFNIASRFIELTGFELEQTEPLQKGLQGKVSNPKAVMEQVLRWTGGQPFLTQRVCQLVSSHKLIHDWKEAKYVEKIVHEQIVENWQAKDEQQHLTTISERILRREDKTLRLLKLYQRILQQREIIADDSSEQLELRLSGLVVKQKGKLKAYNRLYQLVFNRDWVNRALKDQEINRASDGRLSQVREVVEILASKLFSFRLTSRFNYIKLLFIIVTPVGITTIAGLVLSEDFRCTVGFRSDSCLQEPNYTRKTGDTPAIQPSTPAIQPPTRTIQPSTPAIQPPTRTIQPPTRTIQPPTRTIQPSTPAIQPPTRTIQPSTPAIQPSTPAIQPSTPAIQPPTPAIQPPTPAIQPPTRIIQPPTRIIQPPKVPDYPLNSGDFGQRVLDLINIERKKNDLPPLSLNPQLTAAAQGHSQDMALQDYFSHIKPNGSTAWYRINATGYQSSKVAANIAVGMSTPEALVTEWMNSPGQRANILNPELKEIGIGYYFLADDTGKVNYHHYWTQVFGYS
ncbi:MAG: AAA-like domain-containing protein [Symplocastrum torsivum CPER-KK1]|jgi:uncharacterized protein YkwD|uniref:AAA-like domain-containing protein n=1 Tax=Symplocastrum torsivum CPER-KK1 TaxID=450513 RepID=A0A951UD89_9CYAN|nr:AAA-like domain-containing protein [Symplocastrum torsivum CPER-KK1]